MNNVVKRSYKNSSYFVSRFILVVLIVVCNLYSSSTSYASKTLLQKIHLQPVECSAYMMRVTDRTMNHFDADRDGCLNRREYSFYTYQRHTGFPLAKRRSQKKVDTNFNGMLDTHELERYKASRKMKFIFFN